MLGKPRICFVVESGTDVRLVQGLSERSDLTVLGREIPGGRVVSQRPGSQIDVTVGPASRIRFAGQVFAALLHRRRYDAVIVQGYGPAALAANTASRLVGTPTFMLVCSPVELYYECRKHFPHHDMPYHKHQLWALKLLARLNAKIGRHYLTLSRHLEEIVRAHGANRPVSLVPVYGIDCRTFQPATESKADLRSRYSLPNTGSLLFFSSRIAPEKDGETLLEAIARLKLAGREIWVLHLSGRFESFVETAGRLGVADRVIARDAVHPVKELPAYYQASDVCVQASREEGLGFSPLEALACEVPVVATAVGGLRETIRDSETGWSYPMGDAGALFHAISSVLDNPGEAKRRAQLGREMVHSTFERKIVFDRLMQVLGESPKSAQFKTVKKNLTGPQA